VSQHDTKRRGKGGYDSGEKQGAAIFKYRGVALPRRGTEVQGVKRGMAVGRANQEKNGQGLAKSESGSLPGLGGGNATWKGKKGVRIPGCRGRERSLGV